MLHVLSFKHGLQILSYSYRCNLRVLDNVRRIKVQRVTKELSEGKSCLPSAYIPEGIIVYVFPNPSTYVILWLL